MDLLFNSLLARKKMPGFFSSRRVRQRKPRITEDIRSEMGRFKRVETEEERQITTGALPLQAERESNRGC